MQLFENITALGILALVLVMIYWFAQRMFVLLNNHLQAVQDMDNRQAILLQACLDRLSAIEESLQKSDNT